MRIFSNSLEGAAIDLAIYTYPSNPPSPSQNILEDILRNLVPKLFLIIGDPKFNEAVVSDPISIADIKNYIMMIWERTRPSGWGIMRRLHVEIQSHSDIGKDIPIILSSIYASFLSKGEIKLFKKKVSKICNFFDSPANVIVSSIGKNNLKYGGNWKTLKLYIPKYIDMFSYKYVKLAPERVSHKIKHIYEEAMSRILPVTSPKSKNALPFHVWSLVREYLDYLVFEDITIRTITNEIHDVDHPVLMDSINTWRALYKFLLLRWLGFNVNRILVSTLQGGYDEDV